MITENPCKDIKVREGITIPVEDLERMKRSIQWLQCLEEAGVDNWQGISYAYELAEERGLHD